jgi:hypothetical protein
MLEQPGNHRCLAALNRCQQSCFTLSRSRIDINPSRKQSLNTCTMAPARSAHHLFRHRALRSVQIQRG